MSEDADDGPPDISTMSKVEILKDFAARYAHTLKNGCLFKPGDFVTPRKDAPISDDDKGQPHLVLETQPGDIRWDDEFGSSRHGTRPDMRIVRWERRASCFAIHWVESVHFERWTEEG